jgi:hypothetical protein
MMWRENRLGGEAYARASWGAASSAPTVAVRENDGWWRARQASPGSLWRRTFSFYESGGKPPHSI